MVVRPAVIQAVLPVMQARLPVVQARLGRPRQGLAWSSERLKIT
jgi:hypothetical protein